MASRRSSTDQHLPEETTSSAREAKAAALAAVPSAYAASARAGVRVDAVDDADARGDADALAEGVFFALELGVALGKAGHHDGGVFVQRGRDDVELPLAGKVVVVGLNV